MRDDQLETSEPKDEAEEPVQAMTYEAALELIDDAREAWKEIHSDIEKWAAFEDGDQWDAKDDESLQLTYNIVPSFTNHASNVVKKNPPSIKIVAGNDGNEKVATIYDALIEEVEQKSRASSVYTMALEQCAASSFGMFRVVMEQCDRIDAATQQRRTEPRIRAVKDPTTVLIDPLAERPGMSDAAWFAISSTMSKKAFKREFPDAEVKDYDPDRKDWFEADTVRICEFWFKDETRGGKWTQWFLSGAEKIDENVDWPGEVMPLFVVHGRERVYNGKRTFECMTKRIMDPQKVLNAETSAWVQALDGVGGFEWLLTAEQMGPYQNIWDSKQKRRYMPIVQTPATGSPIHAPAAPMPAALMQGSQMASEAMQKILGIRDPMKDLPGSQSGKAIALQMSQSDVAIFGYQFALEVAKEQCGRCLVDLMRTSHNYPHARKIKGKDGQIRTIEISGPGGPVDLDSGSYDVIVSSGPTWESRREEDRENMLKLLQINPEWSQKWGDILVKSFDFDGADQAAARLRIDMPPELLSAGADGEVSPEMQLAAARSQLAKMAQTVEQLTQALQHETEQLRQATDANAQKAAMQQADHAHESQMQAVKGSQAAELEEMKAQMALILKRLDLDGKAGLQESKAGIDANAAQQRAELGDQSATHKAGLQVEVQDAKAENDAQREELQHALQAELMELDAQLETIYPGTSVDQEAI